MARPFAYPQGAEPVSLADLILAETRHESKSKLDLIIEALSDEDRDDLVQCLGDKHIPNTAIARGLTKKGHPIGAEAIRKARRG